MNEKQVMEITDVDANDEKQLIRLAKEGNQPAFTKLITLHQKQVFRLAYGFFQDKDDAMEIVQETFIKLYRKIDDLEQKNLSLLRSSQQPAPPYQPGGLI